MKEEEHTMKIIENTEEAQEKFGYRYGADFKEVSLEEIAALLNGQCLADEINRGEYSVFIILKK